MRRPCNLVAVCLLLSVAHSGRGGDQPPQDVDQIRPAQGRPYFLPPAERERIRGLIRSQPWAAEEFERIRGEAEQGNGFWAAFLCAFEGDKKYLEAARNYLVKTVGPEAWGVREYTKRLADPDFFKAGQPHLADVYYNLQYEPFVVFDLVYGQLNADDRRQFEQGIKTLARYRMGAMDRWYQTPNLVFKPTFMAAMAGLTTGDREILQWGFFRTKPRGARLGGYFPALDYMLRDGGPWHEAPIYPVAHEDLWCASIMSRYGRLYDGRDWFAYRLPGGGSARGLMDYYVDTAYPIERTGHGAGQVRVATYGDGATNPGGDLFLVNPAGSGLNMEKALVAAYNASGDERYAAFVKMIGDYRPNLWDRRPLPPKTDLPDAPSKIWPNYGLAMLRSDESPAYWTSDRAIAVFQLMSQGYGHDHRDKFAIMLHGAGRLLYPDYNAIQYESSSIGWTRHSCSHNTLIVDEQDTANVAPTAIRHEFTPDVKYLATSAAGVYEGVDQTRALLLTGEYLLDVFHARSRLPHTYDYMLHCLGEARPAGGNYQAAAGLMSRYWVIDNKRATITDNQWALDFVCRDEPGSRGGNYGDEWYGHTANVRVTMAADPRTQVVHGNWGEAYAEKVRERYRKKEVDLDRLASLVVRRDGLPTTAFVATHEPYANRERPGLRGVVKLAETEDALLVRVDGEQFTDYAAVTFGPQAGRPLHVLSDGQIAVQFRDYVYLRVGRDGRVAARGGLVGLQLPNARGPLTLAGKTVPTAQLAGKLVHLNVEATPPRQSQPPCPFDVSVSPAQLRVWMRDRKEITYRVRNTLRQSVAGRIEFDLPPGIAAEPAAPQFGPLSPGQTATVPVEFAISDPATGRHTIPYRVVYREGDSSDETETLPRSLIAYAGPTIESRYQFPKPPVYRAVTSWYTTQLRMTDGACVFLADDADQVRLDGEPLFLLAEGEGDDQLALLGAEPKTGGVWVGHEPANLVAEASGRNEKRNAWCRWQVLFMVNRLTFRMDPDWTQFERARFVVPGNWRSPKGRPQWKRIVAVNDRGDQRDVRPGDPSKIAAALLEFPGSRLHLAFQFNPPVPVIFSGTGMEFEIGALKRENWSIGFCAAEDFDSWRGASR